ncbi:murein L,D-transpeptidase family protein [Flexibacterium corallicola]|uniref:murein L,D-transpeptidase family protein n=1 Tax=Flexibacterium corallicola TaxID=3037259 RepID=UPI00286F3224|nr:murein L,D-transpeptidase family protein [Pseudovibrio sp. M1P-2-3]
MFSPFIAGLKNMTRPLAAIALASTLIACQGSEYMGAKHEKPISDSIKRKIQRYSMDEHSPILVRLFKEESELEVWKEARSGTYELLETFEICKWSGKLGPKFKEGDRQAPEGFYKISRAQMNPNSDYYLAFNLGFPNKYDRAHDRTGTFLMVHGACSSRGCYAMTDEQISDIYALARESFLGGQRKFQVHAFPFRMTAKNMAKHSGSEHYEFWKMLKEGSDHFEVTGRPPKIDVCDKKYVFNANLKNSGARFNPRNSCPAYEVPQRVAKAVAQKQLSDNLKIQEYQTASVRRKERQDAVASFFGNEQGPARSSLALQQASGPSPKQPTAAQLSLAPIQSQAEKSESKKQGFLTVFNNLIPQDDNRSVPTINAVPQPKALP